MQLKTNPKRLFLLDGMGALISAFFLGIVLVAIEPLIGMPKNTLYILAIIPCVFAVYSFSCYFFIRGDGKPFLKGIAIANLVYCFVTIGLLYCYSYSLTVLGYTYFVLELLIVGILIAVELRCASSS